MIADEQLSTMSLSELRELQDKLSKRIQGLVNAEKQEATKKILELIDAYGIDRKAIFGRSFANKGAWDAAVAKRKVEPKYRDPETGKTWTGRGKPPKWMSGVNRDDFKIHAAAA